MQQEGVSISDHLPVVRVFKEQQRLLVLWSCNIYIEPNLFKFTCYRCNRVDPL